jgi:hypothetical protein
VIRSPRSDRLMTLHGEVPRSAQRCSYATLGMSILRHPIVTTAHGNPLSPVNDRIVSMRRGGSRCAPRLGADYCGR